jgi:hypothetical protein
MQLPAINTSGIMFELSADAYGLGHFIETLPDGRRIVSHGGQNAGWISYYYIVPDTGDGIVILTNSERSFQFIAQLVSDWAYWCGLGAIKMSQAVLRAASIIQSVTVLVFLITLWQGWRLIHGFARRERRFTMNFRDSRPQRFGQVLLVFILLGLWWGINHAQFMELFPVLWGYLSLSLVICAMALLLTTLFPKHEMAPPPKKLNP